MSNLYKENDFKLAQFFRDLADNVESKNISPEQLRLSGEFFMSYKFHQVRNGTTTDEDNEDNEDNTVGEGIEDCDGTDIVKFITLGWYIYKFILDEGIGKDDTNSTAESHTELPTNTVSYNDVE